jgi:hypothetical protein
MEINHVMNPEPIAATMDLPKVELLTLAIFAPIHIKKDAKKIAIRAAIMNPPIVSSGPAIIDISFPDQNFNKKYTAKKVPQLYSILSFCYVRRVSAIHISKIWIVNVAEISDVRAGCLLHAWTVSFPE